MADESRIENILDATLGEPGAEVPSPPFSRIEEKLIELKEAIESGGGGGGGTTNYNDLTNKPSINGHALQGNSTLDTLGIASKSTLDAAVEELELMEAEIDGKVDKETGKGLSTNDFTNTDKADLATALAKANAAAPQATTYTISEVNSALAAKLNTADVDAALSETSANPVQNKAVQAPIARLVDAVAKNLLKVTGSSEVRAETTYTINPDGSVTISQTAPSSSTRSFEYSHGVSLAAGTYRMSSGRSGRPDIRCVVNGVTYYQDQEFTISESTVVNVNIYVYANDLFSTPVTIYPMLCTAEDYAISPEFVPYAPTMREMYEMILALQNGG